MITAETTQRVARNTSDDALLQIRDATHRRIEYLAQHPDEIPRRLQELDAEWDVERCLETGSASLTLTGLVLGAIGKRRWLLLSLIVQGFFLQHAIEGWCPPLPLLRRLGVRTAEEIDQERYALTALQGKFSRVTQGDARAGVRASEAVGLQRGPRGRNASTRRNARKERAAGQIRSKPQRALSRTPGTPRRARGR